MTGQQGRVAHQAAVGVRETDFGSAVVPDVVTSTSSSAGPTSCSAESVSGAAGSVLPGHGVTQARSQSGQTCTRRK